MRAEAGDRDIDAASAAEDTAVPTLLTFDLGGQTYGIDVRGVLEVLEPQRVTRLPSGGSGTIGLIDLRGRAITVMDLARLLGVASPTADDETRIVVLRSSTARDGATAHLAFHAERVRDVWHPDPAAVEALNPSAARPLAAVPMAHGHEAAIGGSSNHEADAGVASDPAARHHPTIRLTGVARRDGAVILVLDVSGLFEPHNPADVA
ncbi:MAG: chemotaxis protein CheW [Pseudomonadota bacterium]